MVKLAGPSARPCLAFLFFHPVIIFILPESNTFSPNRVGRQPMRPGAAMATVANRQCLQGLGCIRDTVLRNGGNHPKTGLCKNKILAPPEFLFFRRVTIFQFPMLISRSRGGLCSRPISRPPLTTGHHRRDNGGAQRLRPVLFDILNWGLASGAMGLCRSIGDRVGMDRTNRIFKIKFCPFC